MKFSDLKEIHFNTLDEMTLLFKQAKIYGRPILNWCRNLSTEKYKGMFSWTEKHDKSSSLNEVILFQSGRTSASICTAISYLHKLLLPDTYVTDTIEIFRDEKTKMATTAWQVKSIHDEAVKHGVKVTISEELQKELSEVSAELNQHFNPAPSPAKSKADEASSSTSTSTSIHAAEIIRLRKDKSKLAAENAKLREMLKKAHSLFENSASEMKKVLDQEESTKSSKLPSGMF